MSEIDEDRKGELQRLQTLRAVTDSQMMGFDLSGRELESEARDIGETVRVAMLYSRVRYEDDPDLPALCTTFVSQVRAAVMDFHKALERAVAPTEAFVGPGCSVRVLPSIDGAHVQVELVDELKRPIAFKTANSIEIENAEQQLGRMAAALDACAGIGDLGGMIAPRYLADALRAQGRVLDVDGLDSYDQWDPGGGEPPPYEARHANGHWQVVRWTLANVQDDTSWQAEPIAMLRPGPYVEGNARRIAATLNAVMGVPTERLTAIAVAEPEDEPEGMRP